MKNETHDRKIVLLWIYLLNKRRTIHNIYNKGLFMLSLNVQNTVTTLTVHYSHRHHTFYNNYYIKTSQGKKPKTHTKSE